MNIFYSWQSDLPNSTNRGFIKGALEGAVKELHKQHTLTEPARIDSGTQGEPGAPDIANTIFDKISICDVFVADVSIINHGVDEQRPTPNPNVLVELGYALRALGPRRVLMVQNTAHGDQADLPFDLRYRRVVPYSLLPMATSKPDERKKLQGQLKAQLNTIAKDIIEPQSRVSTSTVSGISPNWHELHQNAVDRLTSDSREVRRAAIHTLENVAKHSPDHHWQIVELFTSILQERLRLSNDSTRQLQVGPEEQAIITALGRRQLNYDIYGLNPDSAEAQDRVISLSRLHLQGANFTSLHFERATFVQSVLEGCLFDGCHLEKSIFQRAIFRASSL